MNILLLHGALGTKRQLAFLADGLDHAHCRSLTFTGHGEDELPEDGLSFDRFLHDIDTALEKVDSAVHIFGYSMGGYAALLWAARNPGRVASVTTLGTKLVWTPEGLQKELKKLDPAVMEEKVPEFAMGLAAAHGPERWKELVKRTADLMTGLAAQPLLTDEVLAAIECPVLLIVGDRDTTAVPEDTLLTARKLKDAGVMVLPRTRHPFEEVDLDLLITQLSRFWEGMDGE
ncbi:MAG TPA: alpha/beta fold hydrolase [Flavobacteriales bacterium]|mgnify:CR=1 FL=1|nr:alpha/beta fold hydrolase [Flavobacteriales bacterium]HQW87355.1 alpha/beta fold hydrolase [Flavobacteriales bacterium]